jgi:ribosomal protein S19E (S16A)
MKTLSTSALAKERNIESKDLFKILSNKGWIYKNDDKWNLTNEGKSAGGEIKNSQQYGDYIVWPENINWEEKKSADQSGKLKYYNATHLGEHFEVSNRKINLILNELGWVQKTIAGWGITKIGKSLGGLELTHETSGQKYVKWPEAVLNNSDLLENFGIKSTFSKETKPENVILEKEDGNSIYDYRKKYPAEFRCKDGHYVRSQGEMAIDDSLYLWGIPHAYEKKLPNTLEEVLSDFHIPSGPGRPYAVYIEYWGVQGDENYNKRREHKLKIYDHLKLKLIELTPSDLKNLEDTLQRELLKKDIKVIS